MKENISNIIANMSKDELLNIMRKEVEHGCKIMFNLSYNWRLKYKNTNEKENFAFYMFQQQLANIKSILELSMGIDIYPGQTENKVIEPTSIISVVRSVYERMFIFHCIYVLPETREEQDIFFYIWLIKGLKNRQNIEATEQYKEKQLKEKEEIENEIEKIQIITNSLNIKRKAKEKILKIANDKDLTPKGYKFIKNSNNKIVGIKKISLSGASNELFGKNFPPIYRFFSMHTHPSYLGTLQFSQLFDGKEDKSFMLILLKSIALFQGKIIHDFVSTIEGAKEIYNNLPSEDRDYCDMICRSIGNIKESYS